MAKPYVYRCEHKITGEFYIGYREANTVPAAVDFGTYYFTSCPRVKNNFREFSYKILGEFRNASLAYEIEQKLIYNNRHNKLLINRHWKNSKLVLNIDEDLSKLTYHTLHYNKGSGKAHIIKKIRNNTQIAPELIKVKISTDIERFGTDKSPAELLAASHAKILKRENIAKLKQYNDRLVSTTKIKKKKTRDNWNPQRIGDIEISWKKSKLS